MNDDLATWLHQQVENQRHTGDALKALAAALPTETGVLLAEAGDFLVEDASAKRRMVDLHSPHSDGACPTCWRATPGWSRREDYPCPTLRLLAPPFDGRDGYRDEWKP